MSFGHPIVCAGCGTKVTHEGVTSNDNTGRLWCTRDCKEKFLAAEVVTGRRVRLASTRKRAAGGTLGTVLELFPYNTKVWAKVKAGTTISNWPVDRLEVVPPGCDCPKCCRIHAEQEESK